MQPLPPVELGCDQDLPGRATTRSSMRGGVEAASPDVGSLRLRRPPGRWRAEQPISRDEAHLRPSGRRWAHRSYELCLSAKMQRDIQTVVLHASGPWFPLGLTGACRKAVGLNPAAWIRVQVGRVAALHEDARDELARIGTLERDERAADVPGSDGDREMHRERTATAQIEHQVVDASAVDLVPTFTRVRASLVDLDGLNTRGRRRASGRSADADGVQCHCGGYGERHAKARSFACVFLPLCCDFPPNGAHSTCTPFGSSCPDVRTRRPCTETIVDDLRDTLAISTESVTDPRSAALWAAVDGLLEGATLEGILAHKLGPLAANPPAAARQPVRGRSCSKSVRRPS